jgi:hypothetical protein
MAHSTAASIQPILSSDGLRARKLLHPLFFMLERTCIFLFEFLREFLNFHLRSFWATTILSVDGLPAVPSIRVFERIATYVLPGS